jgi:hypothetical protein
MAHLEYDIAVQKPGDDATTKKEDVLLKQIDRLFHDVPFDDAMSVLMSLVSKGMNHLAGDQDDQLFDEMLDGFCGAMRKARASMQAENASKQ